MRAITGQKKYQRLWRKRQNVEQDKIHWQRHLLSLLLPIGVTFSTISEIFGSHVACFIIPEILACISQLCCRHILEIKLEAKTYKSLLTTHSLNMFPLRDPKSELSCSNAPKQDLYKETWLGLKYEIIIITIKIFNANKRIWQWCHMDKNYSLSAQLKVLRCSDFTVQVCLSTSCSLLPVWSANIKQ